MNGHVQSADTNGRRGLRSQISSKLVTTTPGANIVSSPPAHKNARRSLKYGRSPCGRRRTMSLRDELIELRACAEAVKWVGERDLESAWRDCERGDWMLWYVGKLDGCYSPRLRAPRGRLRGARAPPGAPAGAPAGDIAGAAAWAIAGATSWAAALKQMADLV